MKHVFLAATYLVVVCGLLHLACGGPSKRWKRAAEAQTAQAEATSRNLADRFGAKTDWERGLGMEVMGLDLQRALITGKPSVFQLVFLEDLLVQTNEAEVRLGFTSVATNTFFMLSLKLACGKDLALAMLSARDRTRTFGVAATIERIDQPTEQYGPWRATGRLLSAVEIPPLALR